MKNILCQLSKVKEKSMLRQQRRQKEVNQIMLKLSKVYRPNSDTYKTVQAMLKKATMRDLDALWCMVMTTVEGKD